MKSLSRITLRIYWNEMRKKPFLLGLILIAVTTAVALSIYVPIVIKELFDILAGENPTKASLEHALWLLAAVALGQRLSWTISDYASSLFHPGIIAGLYGKCFDYLHRHSVSFFNNNFVGSLVKRVNRFVWAYDGLVNTFLWDFFPLVLNIVGILGVLAFQHIGLALIVFVWFLFVLSTTIVYSNMKYPIDFAVSKLDSTISGHVADTVTNHVNVKFFDALKTEQRSFGKILGKWKQTVTRSWLIDGHFRVFQGISVVALEVGILYFAIQQWDKGLLTIGDFVLIEAYVITLSVKAWDLKHIIRRYYKNIADAQEMAEVFDAPHEIVDKRGAKSLKVQEGGIIFDDVTFSYKQTRRVFHKLTLTIAPHEKVALVGHSGAGKSTMIKLLMRQHDVTGGRILIDNQSIADVTTSSLWKQVSFVAQDSILFHRSLMENIRYGRPGATNTEVMKAAKAARAHQFIKELPDGYNTYVGERGVKLSGGERQRVAIARAILRDAPILILDEATSSLDSESEALIQEGLERLMQNKTVLVIAHRLSTIQKMDRILVFDSGQVIEDGAHNQLRKKRGGVYRKLWEMQAGGFISE